MKDERFLLDTSVISMFAPGKTAMRAKAARWFAASADHLINSTVTLMEIEQRISKLERAKACGLWLDGLVTRFADRPNPVTPAVARLAGTMADEAFAVGRHPGAADVLIAATARALDAVALTRHSRHFEPLGVTCVDPFAPDFPTQAPH